ncbi:MAG: FAD-dependent oxidoreductase [Candidatus Aenigmarchaeota archaeon]|nr:FAD-dependent oxidoreductase [Candidatus Aenigmarchaeota archaeon]MBU5689424.1 FAD-dependent oxidoreductase [Candidatus Aenigmarchaeota archaeon]
MEEFDVAILGGGITGLTAAQECAKKGLKTIIIEKNSDLGGLLYSIKSGKSYIEAYYHHFFTNDIFLIDKLKELKLDKKIDWVYASTAFLFDSGIYELSAPQHILFFKPLTIEEKIQFIFLMLKVKLTKNIEELDNIKAKDWIIKNSSKSLYKKMFEPLLKSKFGKKAEEISAAWFVERINLRGERNLKGEKLGYIKGGFKILIDALEKDVKKLNVQIILNASIEKIEKKDIFEIFVNGNIIKTKSIISTIPLHVLKKYCLFDQYFIKKIDKIEYQGSLCILVSLKKKLTKYYWTNIVKKSEIGAIIEHTNFQPKELYDGHLVYIAQYPDNDSPIWQKSEEEIWRIYFSELKRLFPHINDKDVKWYKVFKGFNAGVLYKKGFKKNLLAYDTPLKGLFIGGLFNMYPERSTNLGIKIGKELAEKTYQYLNNKKLSI